MKLKEIRDTFINFFVSKNHKNLPSSGLVPFRDDSLIFTNSGMVQFKKLFLGLEVPKYPSIVTIQKCVRAGGKHNDLSNVGFTNRHHTFFEMLGNFSFGSYFKEDAILLAWEFLTKVLKIPHQSLCVTIFEDDEETKSIWLNKTNIDENLIFKQNKENNFWEMGATGPCGPCTEIYYDRFFFTDGAEKSSQNSFEKNINERYIELWNIVFMQYNRLDSGELHPLLKPCVDTGIGLERLSSVLQGVKSNYDTDLFLSIIQDIKKRLLIKRHDSSSLNVIADHIRSSCFLICDGVLPSNEGRGYVLRKIIRRAILHGRKLGNNGLFFYKLSSVVVKEMGDHYKDLIPKKHFIENTLKEEESKFKLSLDRGLLIFESEIKSLKNSCISGDLIFKLYDTYGLPVDLVEELAEKKKIFLDIKGFHKKMKEQNDRSRKSNKFCKDYSGVIFSSLKSIFLDNHDPLNSVVLAMYTKGNKVDYLSKDTQASIILDKTNFYPESGGQIGDQGFIKNSNFIFQVNDTQKNAKAIVHIGKVLSGFISRNSVVQPAIDFAKRKKNSMNHTATHILHSSLHKVVGRELVQKGSKVDYKKSTFDFIHNKPLSQDELLKIETLAMSIITSNVEVVHFNTSLESAKKMGCISLFEEKYAGTVRVVQISNFSMELCGGTHVKRTGEIGLIKLLKETGISSGIRRIEFVTSQVAYNYLNEQLAYINKISLLLNTHRGNVLSKVKRVLEESSDQKKTIDRLDKYINYDSKKTFITEEYFGIEIISEIIEDFDNKHLINRSLSISRNNLEAIVFLFSRNFNSVKVTVCLSKKLLNMKPVILKIFQNFSGTGGGSRNIYQGTVNFNNSFLAREQVVQFFKEGLSS